MDNERNERYEIFRDLQEKCQDYRDRTAENIEEWQESYEED
jgi:hypothetical protein